MSRQAEEVMPAMVDRLEQAARQCERGTLTADEALDIGLEALAHAETDCRDGPMGSAPAAWRVVPLLAERAREWAAGRAWQDPGLAAEFEGLVIRWQQRTSARHRRFAGAYESLRAVDSLGDRALIAGELERLRREATAANEDRLVQAVAETAGDLGIWEVLAAILTGIGRPRGIAGHSTATARKCLQRLAAVDPDAAAALERLSADA